MKNLKYFLRTHIFSFMYVLYLIIGAVMLLICKWIFDVPVVSFIIGYNITSIAMILLRMLCKM